MNTRNLIIGLTVIILLGGAVWWGMIKPSQGSSNGNLSTNNPVQTNTSGSTNLNTVPDNPTNSDARSEAYWNTYWDDLVQKAKGSKKAVSFGGFVFQVPKSLIGDDSGTSLSYTFHKDAGEAPYIGIRNSTDTPDQVVATIKKNLSTIERVVQEKTEAIHGVQWTVIEQTTDFGINQVTWVVRRNGNTIEVIYPVFRENTVEVFKDIVHSAVPQ